MVYVFLADGFEEIEALTPVDLLRRAGVEAVTVSIYEGRKTVTGARKITVCADITINEAVPDKADVIVLPGGMPGTKNLAKDTELMGQMIRHYEDGGVVAAICAAPGLVVSQLPTLEGKCFTCYDGFEEAPMAKGGEYTGEPAVTDGNLITGRGPGCAVRFALEIVKKLKGEEIADQVEDGLLV